ncbi:MAG: hypothetical protein J6C46_01600 [Clostridia bacterium]|nr:hypothetical protein [Clostridia bacterium]
MKKIPKLYKVDNNKIKDNNQLQCNIKKEEKISVKKQLDEIFSGLVYPYNVSVEIITKDKKYDTSIIARTKDHILTLENHIIPIKEIISIKKKKVH